MPRLTRPRLLTGACALALLMLAYGCAQSAKKTPKPKPVTGVGASSTGGSSTTGAAPSGEGGAPPSGNGGVSPSGEGGVAHSGEGGVSGAGAPASSGAAGADDSNYAGSGGDGACTSGQTRCVGQLGYQRCTPHSVWGPSISCGGYSENGTSSYCGTVDAGTGPWAVCMDPACWWWLQSGSGLSNERAGVCVGTDQLRQCLGGVLATTPKPCDGTCRSVSKLDGREIGYCDPACTAGERECLGGALYRECVNGRWSSQAQTCAGGEACQPLASGAHSNIKCGGACELGTSRCSLDGTSVEECGDTLEWKASAPCTLGHCVASAAQAQCQTECKPGERACAFDGAPNERVCNELGLWNEPTNCDAGAVCRLGSAGAQGCLKCVGPSVPGGNVWGVADSHCADGVAECGDANAYSVGTPCPDGQSCTEVARGAATLAYCQ